MKTALITGASSGLGTHIVHAFKDYRRILTGTNEDNLDILGEKTKSSVVVANLGTSDGIATVKDTIRTFDIDILVNCAGVNFELDGRKITEQEKADTFQVNATAPIELSKAAFEHMKTKGGTILNINSVYGLKPQASFYSASKQAFRVFSESVKDKWLDEGVRMIDVFPHAIATGMSAHRTGAEFFIDPMELSSFLLYICGTDTFFAREVHVGRTRYK